MTPEAQRIAIATACGWTACGCVEGCNPHGYPPDARKPTTRDLIDGTGPTPWDIPDYPGDLNAMHEARKSMTHAQRVDMVVELYKICDREWSSSEVKWSDVVSDPVDITSAMINAPSEWSAEAFLRTLSLWED